MNKDIVIQLLSNRIAQLEVDKAIAISELAEYKKEVEKNGTNESSAATQSAKTN